MAGNVLNAQNINSQIAQDAIQMHEFYLWLKQRYEVWIVNAGNSTQLTTAGITSSTDQNQIFALEIDMNRLIGIFEGTQVASAGSGENIIQDIAFVRGCN